MSALTALFILDKEVSRVSRTSAKKAMSTIAGIGVIALVLSACGGGSDNAATSSAPTAGGSSAEEPAATSAGSSAEETDSGPVESSTEWCQTVKDTYGDLTGTKVGVYTTIGAPEDVLYQNAWKKFTDCTGSEVVYEGSKDFEAQLGVRVNSGNPPDIAIFPQPGLLTQVVDDTGAVLPVPELAAANVDKYWTAEWKNYGSVGGTLYATPNSANFKSMVWYSPKFFEEKGWEVPTTWDEVITISDEAAGEGIKPWCVGLGSGEATGWPATDWLEDFVLRTAGPEVYDQWVAGEVKFSDPQIAESLAAVGKIMKDPKYVNGGFGDVSTIASTTFQDGGLPILKNECVFHRQASFYEANLSEAGATIAEDGDAYAFYLPTFNEDFGNVALGGGEFFGAFNDRPEVQAFQYFLTTPDYVNDRAKGGNFNSAHKGLDVSILESPIQRFAAETLQSDETIFRFDASDMMPAAVGSSAEWKELVNWVNGQDDATTLANIDAAWPR